MVLLPWYSYRRYSKSIVQVFTVSIGGKVFQKCFAYRVAFHLTEETFLKSTSLEVDINNFLFYKTDPLNFPVGDATFTCIIANNVMVSLNTTLASS